MSDTGGLLRTLDTPGGLSRVGRAVVTAGLVLVGAFLLVAFVNGDKRLTPVPGFVTAHAVGVVLVGCITAMLLFGHAAATKRRGYLLLGATYVFLVAVMAAIPLVFPGAVLVDHQLLGGTQSPVALYYVGHLGLILGLTAGALVLARDHDTHRRPGLPIGIAQSVALAVIAAAIPVLSVLVMPEWLPSLVSPSGTANDTMLVLDWLILAVNAACLAVVAWLARRGALIHVFLLGTAVIHFGAALVNISSPERWSLGWYFDRGFTFAASAILLLFLIALLSRVDRATVELAERDTLTGVLRRPVFVDALGLELARLEAGGAPLALLWVDLDGFKSVNDRLGHQAADEVLAQLGWRLVGCAGPHDMVARLGGDEFGILLVDLSDKRRASAVAEAILEAIRAPIAVADTAVLLTASIGVAVAPEDGAAADSLLHRSDLAMFAAKKAGGDRAEWFHPDLDDSAMRSADVRAGVAQAVRDGGIDTDYQPIFTVAGEPVGWEALARWVVEDRRVPAGQFIPDIASTQHIRAVGRSVVAMLAADLDALLEPLPPDGFVSFNLSPSELQDPGLMAALLEGPLRRRSANLVVEITEDAELLDGSPAMRHVEELRLAGFRLAIDDFGTGFSNFTRLERLRPALLKLDKSLVLRMSHGGATSRDFVVASTRIAQAVAAKVVAEGVESDAARHALADIAVDYIQGTWCGPPVPRREQLRRLAESARVPQAT